MRIVSLGVLLYGFWLLLSGHYVAWLLIVGALATSLTLYFANRMQLVDNEGVPLQTFGTALTYWPWLIVQIFKSAWAVTRIILSPRLPISPTVVAVKAGQKTSVGLTTYANSITLTPGTISVLVDGGRGLILVHALTRETAQDLLTGEMDRRVTAFEGLS